MGKATKKLTKVTSTPSSSVVLDHQEMAAVMEALCNTGQIDKHGKSLDSATQNILFKNGFIFTDGKTTGNIDWDKLKEYYAEHYPGLLNVNTDAKAGKESVVEFSQRKKLNLEKLSSVSRSRASHGPKLSPSYNYRCQDTAQVPVYDRTVEDHPELSSFIGAHSISPDNRYFYNLPASDRPLENVYLHIKNHNGKYGLPPGVDISMLPKDVQDFIARAEQNFSVSCTPPAQTGLAPTSQLLVPLFDGLDKSNPYRYIAVQPLCAPAVLKAISSTLTTRMTDKVDGKVFSCKYASAVGNPQNFEVGLSTSPYVLYAQSPNDHDLCREISMLKHSFVSWFKKYITRSGQGKQQVSNLTTFYRKMSLKTSTNVFDRSFVVRTIHFFADSTFFRIKTLQEKQEEHASIKMPNYLIKDEENWSIVSRHLANSLEILLASTAKNAVTVIDDGEQQKWLSILETRLSILNKEYLHVC